MEFCPQLSVFQGAIISADNVHPFSRLTSRGGNEEKIQYIVDSISNFLEDGNYSNKDGLVETSIAKVRKFAFFIILNSDLTVLSEMTDIEEIELVIWTIPTIPKCLMCEFFWRLNFDKFVYEAISFCNPDLALEIASAFIDNIKYYTPSECLNKISIISSALYKLLCRIYFFNYHNNSQKLPQSLTTLLNSLQKTIKFYTEPPKSERLNSLSKDDQYKYIGKCVNAMLLLIYECTEEFMSTQDLDRICDPLYSLTYIGNVIRGESLRPCECPQQDILDCINQCNLALLDKFQELIMAVSVDIFCAWSEFEENGKSTQRKIGELCYNVRTKLLSISSLAEHPVVDMMQQISCKPKDLGDIIKNSDTATIVENIKNCEDKAKWLRVLIEAGNLYQDDILLNCVANNLQVLTDHECYNIYKNVQNVVNRNADNSDMLHSFMVKLFQCCNIDAKQEILNETFSNNCFINMKETEEFTNMMTETFNKFIASCDSEITDVLTLFLQNPQKVYTKIFNLATENIQQTNIMLRIMSLLDKFSSHYYSSDTEPCIIRVCQNAFDNLDSDAKKHNIISFICGLKNSNSITGTKLLILIIMPNIHKGLLERDIASLNIQCKLLNDAYTLDELLEYRAPMSAMLGQILDTVRWKINTFSNLAPATLQLALELQISLFKTYNSSIPDNECSWLKNKLRNLQPLNMYYYRQLWNPPGNNFVEVISGINLKTDVNTQQLVIWISQVLCSTTQQEWCDIWDSLTSFGDEKTLELFHKAISLITQAEKTNHTESTWACVLYCYRNFVYIIRYKYFKDPLDDTQVSSVIKKITESSNLVCEDSIEDMGVTLLPLFAYLAETKGENRTDIAHHLNINLKHPKFREILLKVFSNGTV